MSRVQAMLLPAMLLSALLVAAVTGCTSAEQPRVECRGRSTLTSLDPRTGDVAWQARLTQASELPLQVEEGLVVVSAPCGAAVVDADDGHVRYDGTTPGQVVGVAGRQLFTLDESVGGSFPVTGIDLAGSRQGSSFSTNTAYQDATVADGNLVTLYGDELQSTDERGDGPGWRLPVPVHGSTHLVRSGHLWLVPTGDGSVFAVDRVDGHLAWRTVPPVAATSYSLRLTGVPGTVLTAATPGDGPQRSVVYATDAGTGRLRWTRPALGVVAADQHLTLLGTARSLEAVDTVTGLLRWRHRQVSGLHVAGDPRTDGPQVAITRHTVVVPQPGAEALGLDRTTGRVRWRGLWTWRVLADGDVVVAATPDGVTAVDERTGAVLWSRPVERRNQQLAVAPDGRLLLLDTDVVPHLGA